MKKLQNNLLVLVASAFFVATVAVPLTQALLPVNYADASAVVVQQGGTGRQSFQVFAPIIGGATQTAQVGQVSLNTSGFVFTSNGAGVAPTFQAAIGAVSSVSNSDSSITISPTTGAVVASINVANPKTWTGAQTVSTVPFTISGNQSAAAWTTSGKQLVISAATLTDTTSSGTVTTNTASAFAIPVFAASSATTYTNGTTLYIAGAPTPGTNVTITNTYSLLVNSGFSVFGGGLTTGTGLGSNANAYISGGTTLTSSSNAAILFAGAGTAQFRSVFTGNIATTALTANTSSANIIIGSGIQTTAATGTHALLANMVVNPLGTVTSGGATVTNTASLYINGAGSGGTSNYAFWVNSGASKFGGTVQLMNYTVATLPTGVQGMTAYVTDALTPTFGTTVVGGGAVVIPVFYNGSAWVSY
ncbi:MAG: hypothetical protein V4478_03340 [Patescibacteria group bacterium]